MIAGMSYYQVLWYFVIYSFFGWCLEVIFHAVTQGKVINRGFLNGPFCPVYGFGVIGVFILVNTLSSRLPQEGIGHVNLLVLFIGGTVLATLVELIAGWLLDVLFHARWWDYSNHPFNFHGYICLSFSLVWGLAIVMVVEVLHPYINRASAAAIPERYGWPILLVIYLSLGADLVVTVLIINKLNRHLKELDRMRASMRIVSDGLSEMLAETSIKTSQKIGEEKVQAALARAELRDRTYDAVSSAMEKTAAMKEMAAEAASQAREKASMAAAVAKDKASLAAISAKEMASTAAFSAREKASTAAASAMEKASMAASSAKEKASMAASSAKEKASMAAAAAGSAKDKASAITSQARESYLEYQRRMREATQPLLKLRVFGIRRLLSAFPDVRSRDHEEALLQVKEVKEGMEKKHSTLS